MAPTLLIGLDGAHFDVLRPLVEAGRLPHIARLMRDGTSVPLRSTTPPMSFPAWSSFATGLAPGRHGIFDFTQKDPHAYRIRFVNATDRTGASMFARVSRAGHAVLCLGVPATFPPEPVSGLLVPGFDAPVSTGTDPRSASDPALYRRVAEQAGPWMRPDLDEGARDGPDGGWHEAALRALLARIDRKTRFALVALRELRASERDPALMTVVFSESDTVAHHFWRDHDASSPRHDPDASAERRGAIAAVYERLDAAVGEIRDAFGMTHACALVSDHGQGGASRRVVHLNQRLAECGLLSRQRTGGLSTDALARRARDLALRWLPPRAAEAVFRRARGQAARVESLARFAGHDWARTAAFSEEANTQPGVWLNLRGREAEGSVAADDAERVRTDVIDALLDWKLPGGGDERVVASALPREAVYEGPHLVRAPDIVVELALENGYAHSLVQTPWTAGASAVRTLADDELAGGRGRGMNGTHRPDGIFVADGLADSAGLRTSAHIVDVAPTVLSELGIEPDRNADGSGTLDGSALRPVPYTADEEARVAARLRALGYLE